MFANATTYDWALMSLGTMGAFVTGSSVPAFNIILGQMINTLHHDPRNFSREVDNLCLMYVYVASASSLLGFVQVNFDQHHLLRA